MIEDNKFDSYEVKLQTPIQIKTGYIVLEDPQLACSEILKKNIEAFKVRIRIRTTDSKESLSPFITNSFSQWREEFLEKLIKALTGHIKQQKEQTIRDFAFMIDKEIFTGFQQGLRGSYQRYCVSERNYYRTAENEEYDFIVDSDDEDKGLSEPEQKVLEGCAEWLLKVDTLFDLMSRSYVYGIINGQKIIPCEVMKKKLYEKWSPNEDEANFKAVLKVVQRWMVEASDARFLSMLRLKSDLEDKSAGVIAAAALIGSELFSVIIGRHNPGQNAEKDLKILPLIDKLNRDYAQYIKMISVLISKFLEQDSTFGLPKRIEIKDELVRIFEKIFSGEASIENEQWQIEKLGDEKPIAANPKAIRGGKEGEEGKDIDFKIDLVALSNSMYLTTK